MDLTGAVVTADAAHTQHDTAEYLVSTKHADYILPVKANQPTLLAQVHALLPPAVPGTEDHLEEERNHGRITRRALWRTPAQDVEFSHATQVFRLRRDEFDLTGARVGKQITYGVTSLHTHRADAHDLVALARGQWGIENKTHWVRDVVYAEDHHHACTGNGAHTMAMIRNLVLGLIRLAGSTQITRTLEWIAADRMRILPSSPHPPQDQPKRLCYCPGYPAEPSFLLHWRDPAKVATAGGIYGVIPTGEFEPSSVALWDRCNDFDLWRQMVREYSEELLGEPEHDGTRSRPIDYERWPLSQRLEAARADGSVGAFFLGLGLDTLTLTAAILTVMVIDDDVFTEVFGSTVRFNEEGEIVSVGGGTPTEGVPFTEAAVRRMLETETMAESGAACLALAWRHRNALGL